MDENKKYDKGGNVKNAIVVFALLLLYVGCADAQDQGGRESRSRATHLAPRDLASEIEAGRIVLASAWGNGASSGAAVEGSISNTSDEKRRIAVHMSPPLYLANTGTGQNMVAMQVFMRDGGYLSDGENDFIEVSQNGTTPVLFIAFCADFERANPTASDRFTVSSVPAELTTVLANIRRQILQHPDADITTAGQIAVWLSQGEHIEAIRERFDYSAEDYQIALALAQ